MIHRQMMKQLQQNSLTGKCHK
uniref:Uncharacterized protein n=1 Tax=Anguilla anguilla TaxID=7936 RepID=A0A0E9T6I5_ANGAN